jgi:Spy/CpxP family protein refolding chaperone
LIADGTQESLSHYKEDTMTDTNLHQSKGRRWWLLLALPVALAGVHVARAWAFGGPGMGMGFGPEEGEHEAFMQRRLEKALDLVKATDSQRAAIKPIIQQLATDLKSIHKQHAQLHKATLDAFSATTLDPAGIENLRVQAAALMDQASKTITTALVQAGNVLTVDQRQTLIQQMRNHGGHHRHGF